MKYISLLTLIICLSISSFGQQLTYVPDNEFEAYIEQEIPGASDGTPQNDYVLTSALENVVTVLIQSSDYVVSDFTGIEDFDTVTQIMFSGQEMVSLDLSHITVTGGGGSVASINSCPNLEELKMPKGEVYQTQVLLNDSLKDLTFHPDTKLNSLTISYCESLDSVDLSNITEFQLGASVIISANPNLEYCNLSNGSCTNVDNAGFTKNPKLFCIVVDDPVYCDNSSDWPVDDPAIQGFIYNYVAPGEGCSGSVGMEEDILKESPNKEVKYYDLLGRERSPHKIQSGEVILVVSSKGTVTKKVFRNY